MQDCLRLGLPCRILDILLKGNLMLPFLLLILLIDKLEKLASVGTHYPETSDQLWAHGFNFVLVLRTYMKTHT